MQFFLNCNGHENLVIVLKISLQKDFVHNLKDSITRQSTIIHSPLFLVCQFSQCGVQGPKRGQEFRTRKATVIWQSSKPLRPYTYGVEQNKHFAKMYLQSFQFMFLINKGTETFDNSILQSSRHNVYCSISLWRDSHETPIIFFAHS